MSWYADVVVPRITDVACGGSLTDPLRRRALAGLSGEVVEIGFGSGHNVRHYPPTVTRVAAIEPSDVGWALARDRVAASRVPVVRAGLDGQSLPFPDAAFDAAVSTWTLCTIPDVRAALGEVRRVLRPGGAFRFVEHGLAPDARVQRWQRRLEPVQRRLAGGCHLTRPVLDLVAGAGFEVREADVFYLDGTPKVLGACTLGAAVVA